MAQLREKPFKARRHARQSLGRQRMRRNRGGWVCFFTALLSFRGIGIPSLTAQGEQRRSSIFNICRDIPHTQIEAASRWHQRLKRPSLRGLGFQAIQKIATVHVNLGVI
jgi:hypothetical protein